MDSISRTNSQTSIPTLSAPNSTPGASCSKPPIRSTTSTEDFFESMGHPAFPDMPELPADINEAAPKANWRTSLEGKINSGIETLKAFGQGLKAKLTQSYEAGKELLHEVGLFLANLGKTLTGIARQPSPDQIPLPPSAPTSPKVVPVKLGAPVTTDNTTI